MNFKEKKEQLKKEYSELNTLIIKAAARMRGIEGALGLLDEMEKETKENKDKEDAKK